MKLVAPCSGRVFLDNGGTTICFFPDNKVLSRKDYAVKLLKCQENNVPFDRNRECRSTCVMYFKFNTSL